MLELTIRLIVSLAIVVGLLLLIAKFGARKFRGGSDSLVQVVHRQALSRTTGVAVVSVGSRVLVLGTTENQVTVLTELDPIELDASELDLDAIELSGFAELQETAASAPAEQTVIEPAIVAPVLPPRPQARAASRPAYAPAPSAGAARPAARVAATPPPMPTAAELILAAAAQHEARRQEAQEPAAQEVSTPVPPVPAELSAALAILEDESATAPIPINRRTSTTTGTGTGPLAGSVLSAQTWKQAFAAARGSKKAS